jgi:uncharacterized repeat protein (TIGR01451 family)
MDEDQVIGVNPSLEIGKVADVVNSDGTDDTDDVVDSAGDKIVYTISVTNTGDSTLTNVVLTDLLISESLDKNGDGVVDSADIVSGDLNDNQWLDLGETWTWTGEYVVSQADINNRGNYDSPIDSNTVNDDLIRNVVFVSTEQGATSSTNVDTTLDYDPQVRTVKTANVVNADGSDDLDEVVDTAGDVIEYTATFTNIGNVSLNDPVVTDETFDGIFDSNGDGVTNADDLFSGDVNGNGILDLGEEWVFKGTYTVTQDDIDNRGNYDGPDAGTANDNIIRNLVSITTQTIDQTIPGNDSTRTEVDYRPVIQLLKTAMLYNADGSLDEDGAAEVAGDVIQYSLSVTNAGNVTLSNVTVVDPLIAASMDKDGNGVINVLDSDGGDVDGDGLLDVGETWQFSGSYTVTQADINALGNYDGPDPGTVNDGVIRNFAGVTSLATDGQQITRDTFVDTRLFLTPELSIDKVFLTVSGGNGNAVADAAGDVLTYQVVVSNTGNVTLTDVTVTDPLTGQNISGLTLAPGESQEFETQYVLTQADLDNRGGGDDDVDNTATADSAQTAPVSDSVAVPLVYTPTLAIDKVFLSVSGGNGNAVADAAGDVLTYQVVVSNTGNVTLTDVTVTDPLTGQNISGLTLAPGESQEFETQYVLTQADLDNRGGGDGDVDNTATADSAQTAPVSDSVAVPLIYNPDLMILKTADVSDVDEVGDLINYTISVSNTGNITLTGLQVTDTLIEDTLAPRDNDMNGVIDGDIDADGLMDVGETWYWTGQYAVTSDDYNAAVLSTNPYYIQNTATADSNETDPESSSEDVLFIKPMFEGLSHGYWKTHASDWDGVATSMSFEEFFFGSQVPELSWKVKTNGNGKDKFATQQDITLMQALQLTGGDSAALAREAVAAVLNVRDEDVTYRFTEEQIKEWVTEALSGQPVDLENDGTIEFAAGSEAIQGVKDLLDYNNNLELV